MKTHRFFHILFSAFGLLLAACAPTARAKLGNVAHYAPAYHGYVIGNEQSAERSPSNELLLLRDPVTERKIRCREELERAAPVLAEVLEARVHDDYWASASPLIMLPVTVVGESISYAGLGLVAIAAAPSAPFLSPNRRTLYLKAREAYMAHRYDEARELFQAVVAYADYTGSEADATSRTLADISLYYLGLSDEQIGNQGRAKLAFRRLLEHASWHNEQAYGDAEARLLRLGEKPLSHCRSQEDFAFPWKEAR